MVVTLTYGTETGDVGIALLTKRWKMETAKKIIINKKLHLHEVLGRGCFGIGVHELDSH